ncbi:MAG: tetratricopeptide repeat protein, partial [Candidatus Latescibacterota bacterium]
MAAPETPDTVKKNDADALADYTVGVFLLESGSASAAISYLESAWENSGHDAHIGKKYAEALFQAGQFERCEAVLDVVLAAEPDNFGGLLLKAKVLYLRSNREEAVACLERLDAVAEPSFEVQRILAKIYTELGRDEDALNAYGRAVGLEPGHPVLHYQYGLLLGRFGRMGEAEEAFVTAVRLRPGFQEAAMEAVGIMIRDSRYDDAEKMLSDLLEADPNNLEAGQLMAEIYIEQEQYERAIELLEDAKQRAGLSHDGTLLLGRLYYETEQYDKALDVFNPLFEKNNNSPELARILGEITAKSGRLDDAEAYYREAIRLGPRDYRNHLALFFAASETFAPEEPERISLEAEEIAELLDTAADYVRDDDFEGLYLVGISYQSVDSLESAREFLYRAREARPEDERVLLNLAGVLERQGKYEEAEPILDEAHALNPEDPTTCNFLGYLLALMGKDLDKAEKLILTALEKEPENGYYIDSLGWVYFVKGNHDRAIIELEKASKIVEDDPTILEHLGDAYSAVDRHAE